MATMQKLDMKKVLKALYFPPREPILVDVPVLQYLMIDGEGRPGSTDDYQKAIEALYAASYTIKFAIKGGHGTDMT